MSAIGLGIDVDSTEVQTLDGKLDALDATLKTLDGTTKQTTATLDSAESALKDTSRATDVMEAAIADAAAAVKGMQGVMTGAAGATGQMDAAVAEAASAAAGAKTKVTGLHDEIDRLQKTVGETADAAKKAGPPLDGLGDAAKKAGAGAGTANDEVMTLAQTLMTYLKQAVGQGTSAFQTMQASIAAIVTPARAATAAVLALVGHQMIGGMVQFSIQLNKMRQTLTAVTGSAAAAKIEFDYVREAADKFGQDYLTAGNAYAKLLAAAKPANMALGDTRTLFEGISAAGAALSLDAADVEGALLAVQQMISKGKVQAEELTGQLGERIPGVMALAADAMKMSVAQLNEALANGEVSGKDFAAKFGAHLKELYGGIATGTESAVRSMNEFDNVMNEFKRIVSDAGFMRALGAFYELMSSVMGSEAAAAVAFLLGRAFGAIGGAMERLAAVLTVVLNPVQTLMAVFETFGFKLDWLKNTTVTFAGVTADKVTLISTLWQVLSERLAKAKSDFASQVGEWAQNLTAIADAFKWMVNTTIGLMVGLTKAIGDVVKAFPGIFAASWSKVIDVTLSAGRAIWEALKAGLTGGDAGAVLKDFMTEALDVSEIMTKVGEAASAAGTSIKESLSHDYVADIGTAIQTGVDKLGEMVEGTSIWEEVTKRVADQQKLAADAIKGTTEESDKLGDSLGETGDKGAKAGREISDRMKEALDLLRKQIDEYRRLEELLRGGKEDSYAVEQLKEMDRALQDAGVSLDEFLASVGLTRDAYVEMLEKTEAMTAALSQQEELAASIAGLITDTAQNGGEGFKGNLESTVMDIRDTLAAPMTTAVEEGVTKGIQGLSKLAEKSKLLKSIGPDMAGALGAGAMTAIGGAISGNRQMIASGIGTALGAAVGSILPGIGTWVGAAIGGAIGGMFGGGDDNWKQVSGTAFDKTSYAQNVTTASVNTEAEEGVYAEGRIAWEGTRALLSDFDAELKEYVESLGGTVKKGTEMVIDEQKTLLAITGTLDERGITYRGVEGKEHAERINGMVQSVMGIAAQIVTAATPPLTEAQKLWREAQERFTDENIEILEMLGFSAKEVQKVQDDIKAELVEQLDYDLLRGLAGSGYETKDHLKRWREAERAMIEAEREQAVATARELGSDMGLVKAEYARQYAELDKEYAEYLHELAETTGEAIAKFTQADRDALMRPHLQTLAQSGTADLKTLVLWRDMEADAIRASWKEERRRAAAMGIGEKGLARIRTAMRDLPLEALTDEFREFKKALDDTGEAAAKATRAQKDELLGPAMDALAQSGMADRKTLADWRRVETRMIRESWHETRAQARALGLSTEEMKYLRRATLDLPLKTLETEFRELKAALDGTGDAVEKITRAQKDDLLGPALQTLVDAGKGGMETMLRWRKLEERQIRATWVETRAQAKALGLSAGEMKELRRATLDLPLKTLKDDFLDLAAAAGKWADKIAEAESRRATVETELVGRVREMIAAEEALRDARRGLAVSDLAPGTEVSQLDKMMAQFKDLAEAARGGDTDAATELAQMAQTLLGQAGTVHGASETYGEIFREVNRILLRTQRGLDTAGDDIREQLDGDLFREVTDRSTARLLKALARLDEKLATLNAAQDKAARKAEKAYARTATGK